MLIQTAATPRQIDWNKPTKPVLSVVSGDHCYLPFDVIMTSEHTTSGVFTLSDVTIEETLESRNLAFISSLTPTVVYVILLMAGSLVGNTIAFLVYYKKFKPSTTRTYILAISVCDLAITVFSMPLNVVVIRFEYNFDYPAACRFIHMVNSILVFFSGFVLVAVALDRQRLMSKRPSSHKSIWRKVHAAIMFCGVCAFICSLPLVVFVGRQTKHFAGSNITGVICAFDDGFVRSPWLSAYNILKAVIFVVCLVTMGVSYGRIALHLRHHKKRAFSFRTESQSDRKCGHSVSEGVFAVENDVRPNGGRAGRSKQLPSVNDDSVFTDEPSTGTGLPENAKMAKPRTKAKKNRWSKVGGKPSPTTVQVPTASEKCCADEVPKEEASTLPESASNSGCIESLEPELESQCAGPEVEITKVQTQNGGDEIHLKRLPAKSTGSGADTDQYATLARTLFSPKHNGSVKAIPTRTTFMMFVLTAVFVVNYLPYLVTTILRKGENLDSEGGWVSNVYHIAYRSLFINSAVNAMVYCFCSAKFRKESRRLFSCAKK